MALLVILLVGSSCPSAKDPASLVADSFVRAYYVDTNIKQAMAYCDDLACETLKRELKLREGQRIGSDTKLPRIAARQIKVLEVAGEAKRFLYEISVKPPDADSFSREAYVKLRKREGDWKVTQFAEIGAALSK